MSRRNPSSNTLSPKGVFVPDNFRVNLNDPDPILTWEVPVTEVLRLIRQSRGRTFSVHVKQFAPNMSQGDAQPGTTKGREVSSYVSVGRKEAMRFVNNAYENVRNTHLVHVSLTQRLFFIGG